MADFDRVLNEVVERGYNQLSSCSPCLRQQCAPVQ